MTIRLRRWATATVAVAACVVLLTSTALAQEASPATDEAAGIFLPETVAGRTLTVDEMAGPSLISQLDPEDPGQALILEDLNALLAGLGLTPEQMHFVNAYVVDDDGNNVVILAGRMEGADSGDFMEPWLTLIASAQYEELEFTDGEFGGKTVTVLTDADYPFDDPPKAFGYGSGDVVWLIGGTEDWALEVLEALPA